MTRKCTKCELNRQVKFYKTPRGRVCTGCQRKRSRGQSRGVRLVETYGITQADYDLMFAAQNGRCAICKGKRPGNLDVDHCHKTGLVRGLLCRRCNRRLLPAATDRIGVLESAIEYLTVAPAVAVIGEIYTPDVVAKRLNEEG